MVYQSLALIVGLSFCVAAAPASLFQSAFTGQGTPKGWSVQTGKAAVDSQVTREGKPSLRVEPAGNASEAVVRSEPLSLQVGKHYELRAWLRTENLKVRDTGRSPVAVGATLAMASMPFDAHAESLGGTREWTQLKLRFTATRAKDAIEIRAAQGGEFTGKFWVEGVSIDEAAAPGNWPNKAAIKTFGPAYRYPTGGWIYLHIEGEPYERGFQHGYLMAKEIEGYVDRCASQLDAKSKARAWSNGRATASAVFLKGFDDEILQEMKGIADGAAAAKAKYMGRNIDLADIVAANTVTELGLLGPAADMIPTGLEGLGLRAPDYFDPKRDVPVTERCSAFAATGKATRDGRMMVAHITMWPLTLAEQTNVMLDVKPTKGHRVLMQSYPGGIQSGTDWYQNDAGVVLTETTIRQSPFNVAGTPVAFRARKAIQYGTNIDKVVEYLTTKNNGLYTNEWLIGDAKNDEIAMYELGTYKTRLYRSSKNDWFGGTEGFYWGCNNAKDLQVRLETNPDPHARPAHIPWSPSNRDVKWVELYDQHKGKIDESFAFLAFRTPPLVSSTSFDAKVASAEMAEKYMLWAVFGKPNQREWVPNKYETDRYPGNNGIHSGGYKLISGELSQQAKEWIAANEAERRNPVKKAGDKKTSPAPVAEDKLWKGYLLPATGGDTWITAGSSRYYGVLAGGDWDRQLAQWRASYRAAARLSDRPLRAVEVDYRSQEWMETAATKGTLLFDALRREMGDETFLNFMREFYKANTTKTVTTAQFTDAAGKAAGRNLDGFFRAWLDGTGLPGDNGGPAYSLNHIIARFQNALIVYGTSSEAGANRYTAERIQLHLQNIYEAAIPIVKDFELTEDLLKTHSVIFIGRPETNAALERLGGRLPVSFDGAAFTVDGKTYASEYEALALAADHPTDPKKMLLVLAGNTPLETVRFQEFSPDRNQYQVLRDGKVTASGYIAW